MLNYPFANNLFGTSMLIVLVIFLFFYQATLKNLFYSFPSVLITNRLIFFTKDSYEVRFSSLYLFLFTVVREISKPGIFLPIFNFTLITCHNIMVYNLESHHSNKSLIWCAAITCAVFSLMTGLLPNILKVRQGGHKV